MTIQTDTRTLGEIAFTAYRNATNGLTYDNKPIPEWDMVHPGVKPAWEEAAYAARYAEQGMRIRQEIEERLAAIVETLAVNTFDDESAIERSVWLHQRARELVWVLRPDLYTKEHDHVLELIEQYKAEH